jgi:hypothetical protein
MAYETGSAANMNDLLGKISTFAVANGWTEDEMNTGAGKFALHKGDVWVSFRWDPATPDYLSISQALGYTGGNEPGTHPDDSGNGWNANTSHANASLLQGRNVQVGPGPYPSYYIFEQDASPAYLHIVVEPSSDTFRHFGFGELIKLGDWVGGEYCYGHEQASNAATSGSTHNLLDGLASTTSTTIPRRAATVHMEGLPGQPGTSLWGQIWGTTSPAPNDTAGNTKVSVQGGFRGGPIARSFGYFSGSSASGLVPMYSIGTWYRRASPNTAYFLGFMPDVRGINIRHFAPKDEITLGLDTWVIFPVSIRTLAAVTGRTYYQGIAYRKVTA